MTELIRRCMADLGYHYAPVEPTQSSSPRTTWTQWGYDDVAAARSVGYGFGESRQAAATSPEDDPVGTYYRSLPASDRRAFDLALWGSDKNRILVTMPDGNRLGIATDGCAAQVRDEVYPDRSAFLTLSWFVENSGSDVDQRVAGDPQYVDAVKTWTTCMKGKGYPYYQVGDGRSEAESNYDTMGFDAAQVREIAIATADAECGETSGTARIGKELEVKYETQFEADNQGKLLSWAELEKSALSRVKDLLADA